MTLFSVLNEVTPKTESNSYILDKIPYVMWSLDTYSIVNGKKKLIKNNSYPDWFIYAVSNSGLYYRIHQTISNLINGEIEIEGGNAQAAFDYLMSINAKEALRQMSYDAALFNGVTAQLSYFKGKIQWIYPDHFQYYRQDKNNSRYTSPVERDQKFYYYSEGWNRVNFSTGKVDKQFQMYEPKRIEGFTLASKMKNGIEVYYDFMRNSNTNYYPHPDGGSLIDAIEFDIEVPKFHRKNIENSISANFVITYPKAVNSDFNKEMEERREIAKAIKESHSGAENAGKGIIAFYDINSPQKAEIAALPTDSNDKKFEITMQQNTQRILTGLGVVAAENFGIMTNAGFSAKSDTILIGQELLIYNVVQDKKKLLETFFDRILEKSGYKNSKVKIKSVSPTFTSIELPQAQEKPIEDSNIVEDSNND